MFDRSVQRQIAINQARTPTQRFEALCDLLDAVRAMAPMDPDAIERRRVILQIRAQEREQLRAHFRELIASQRTEAEPGV